MMNERELIGFQKVFIIAEAGVNHNGSLGLAKRLVDAAKRAGSDTVKFQTFKTEQVISKKAEKADYQKQSTSPEESQFDMVKKLELNADDHWELARYCKSQGILFLSTPFDEQSADLLDDLGMPIFKIPSGEITNIPFLKHVAQKGKPMILSTGMSNCEQIRTALKAIDSAGNRNVFLMHCISAYPAPIEEVNLRAIATLKEEFKLPVGYSDHTIGIEVPLAAVAMGAVMLEKHFTLDKSLPGPDHPVSLDPDELKRLVQGIRKVEAAMGNGVKQPSVSEQENIEIVRKSIVASTSIKKGEAITEANIAIKRPGYGIQPVEMQNAIGCKAKRDIEQDEVITWDQLNEKSVS